MVVTAIWTNAMNPGFPDWYRGAYVRLGIAMAKATLNQAHEVLKLIAQKEIDCEQLQTLLESGILSDLLGTPPQTIDRAAFRNALAPMPPIKSMDPYRVTVDYSKSFKDMVDAGKYDVVWEGMDRYSKEMEEANFIGVVEVFLVGFNHEIKTMEVLLEMGRLGLRPATLQELLALGATFPKLQLDFNILALGTHDTSARDQYIHSPLLWMGEEIEDKRELSEYFYTFKETDWEEGFRFAAVRR